MRHIRIILLSLFVPAVFSAVASLRDPRIVPLTAAAQPPQAPPTIASVADREISSIEPQILDADEAVPEEKFNFSPEDLNIRGSDNKGAIRAQAVFLAAPWLLLIVALLAGYIPGGRATKVHPIVSLREG